MSLFDNHSNASDEVLCCFIFSLYIGMYISSSLVHNEEANYEDIRLLSADSSE